MTNLPDAFRAKRSGSGWVARCPAHDDRTPSLSISRGDRQPWMLRCHAGCTPDAILAAVGLTLQDLSGEPATTKPRIVATYRYEDIDGSLLFEVVRYAPKAFRQRRPDGSGWTWSLGDVRRVLFGLPEIQGQPLVFVVEGERDVLSLRALGLVATTNAGGSGKWRDDYTGQLCAARVARVVVLPDNDEPGRAHAQGVAASCHAAGLKVQVVTLPGLAPKGDVSAWLDAGHTRDSLSALVHAAPTWTPQGAAPGLALTGLDDLLAEPDDPVEWIVDGLIAHGSINLLAGKPKAGKSTLARFLAHCVASGSSFLGRRTASGAVWYVVLEDKRSEVRRHFRALGTTGPVRFLFDQPSDLLAKLAQLAEQERPALVVVDTLQRLIGAKDLNDYAEVTTKLTPLIALARATGAALVLVHHAGKSNRAGTDAVLGSTALAGSADNVFVLSRTERYRLLSSTQRIGDDLPETVIELDDAGRVLSGLIRHEADVNHLRNALLAELTDGLTQAEWLDRVEGRKQIKLQALKALTVAGTIIRTGAGGKADPFRYHRAARSGSGSQVPSNSREPESSSSCGDETIEDSSTFCGSQVPAPVRAERLIGQNEMVPEVPTGTAFVFDGRPFEEEF